MPLSGECNSLGALNKYLKKTFEEIFGITVFFGYIGHIITKTEMRHHFHNIQQIIVLSILTHLQHRY